MKKKIRVVLIQRVFAEYRKTIYDELANFIDFRVLHSRGNVGIPEASTTYSLEIQQTKYGKKETNTFLWVFRTLIKLKPKVIIHEFAIGILSLPFTFLFAKLTGTKFILWSHGYDRKKGFHPEKNIADKYRLWLMKKANALILYGQLDKQLLSKYITQKKIFVAQNTLDVSKLSAIKDKLLKEGKSSVKLRNGFSHKYNLIFIGRLLKDKEPEILIQVYELLKQKQVNTGVHFVGEGEQLEKLISEVTLKGYQSDIFFHGTIHDDIKTGELLFSSNLMIMPGYLGLSVNHAFCFDCPVISFAQGINGPFHSPEVEYVINGETGFLIEDHNVEALAEIIHTYLMDIDLQNKVKYNIQSMIQNVCSVENMKRGVLDAINYTYA